jgi:hypothetical protein
MYPNISYGRQPTEVRTCTGLTRNGRDKQRAPTAYGKPAGAKARQCGNSACLPVFIRRETALSLSHTDSKPKYLHAGRIRPYGGCISISSAHTPREAGYPAVVRARAFRSGYPKSNISTQPILYNPVYAAGMIFLWFRSRPILKLIRL